MLFICQAVSGLSDLGADKASLQTQLESTENQLQAQVSNQFINLLILSFEKNCIAFPMYTVLNSST